MLPLNNQDLIVQERITKSIYIIRNHKVMMDSELADMYGVETKRLNEQVKRNMERFPADFMFQLNQEEWENLKSQIATSSLGGRRTPPLFVKMRQWAANYEDLAKKIDELNQNQSEHNERNRNIYQIIDELLRPATIVRKSIGFKSK